MSQSKTLFYLILATVILLGASSSFLTLFQHWVIAQSSASETQQSPVAEPLGPPLSSIGIRTIISTPKKTVETSVATPVSKAVAYTAPSNPQAVEAMPSLPQTQPEVPSPVARKAVLTSVTPQVEPSKKTVNRQQPALVVYPDELVIEFPKSLATLTNIKKAVSRLLLSKRPLQEYDLLSNRKLDLRHRPYFYRKVLDQFRNPIRYPKQAYRYADYLIDHGSEELDDEEGRFIAIHIPLVQTGLKGPAKSYQAWVDDYASQFDIDPSLVYAVMETESGFNPRAVSRSNAIGLMQLKPDTAGKDVYRYVDLKPGKPSKQDLFDSEQNIRMGVAYLSLLKHDYLSSILNDKIKQMVTISSYNGGIRTVLGLFGSTPERAIQKLNRMNPAQVYRKLRYDHHSDETRRYLDKVLKAEVKYRALLNDV